MSYLRPRSSMPMRRSTMRSNLTFCPILAIALRSSNSGFTMAGVLRRRRLGEGHVPRLAGFTASDKPPRCGR